MKPTNPYDLPHETENEVLLALVQVLGSDVDDVAADRLGRPERQSEVLVALVHVQFSLLDGVLVYRLLLCLIHQLAAIRRTVSYVIFSYTCIELFDVELQVSELIVAFLRA